MLAKRLSFPLELSTGEYFGHLTTALYTYPPAISPKIMLLSGLGDRKAVEALGIPSVVHLPEVGANYQDHPLLCSVSHLPITL